MNNNSNSAIGHRDKHFRLGKKCTVKMNYFPVHFRKELFAYKVSFMPLISERWIIDKILEKVLPKGKFVYDDFTVYTVSRLGSIKEFSYTRDEGDELKILLKYDSVVGNDLQILHVIDMVLRTILSKKYIPAGRYFYRREKNDCETDLIGQGLECRHGFYQKLCLAEKGHFSLNIDVAFAPFYRNIKVDEFVVEYLNIRDTSCPLSPSDWAKVKLFLSGVKVMHINVEYKILDIPFSPTDRLFEEEGTTVHWTYIVVGYGPQPIYFPMEVCEIVQGQPCFQKLKEKQEAAISQRYTKKPEERKKSVIKWIEEIKNHTKEFGLQVNKKPISITDARRLPAPKLICHNILGQEVKVDPSTLTGKWSLHEMKFFNGGTLRNWAAINFSPIDSDSVYRFMHDLRELCILKGMVFERVAQSLTCASVEDIEGSLERLYMECGEERLQILFVILPDMSDSYGRIKTFLETQLGVVSQCILSENVKKCGEAKFSAQFFENLAQKINAKVGGSNTCLADAPSFPTIADRGTIILGGCIDHCRDGSSISAVVACMDPLFLKYRCMASPQTQGEQIVDMVNIVREHISFYREIQEELYPKRVVYYRAVGSEGIQSDVLTAEVDAIKEAFSALEAGIPRITLVLAERRHNTSMYPDAFGEHWMGNVLPGTVVDTKLCQPDEFFLCSHGGVQGTSRPTHYRVLYNTNDFTIDTLEAFTYVLCFTSAKCTRSISTVPPVYYARLAAARTRVYLEYASTGIGGSLLSHPNIRDQMYFI